CRVRVDLRLVARHQDVVGFGVLLFAIVFENHKPLPQPVDRDGPAAQGFRSWPRFPQRADSTQSLFTHPCPSPSADYFEACPEIPGRVFKMVESDSISAASLIAARLQAERSSRRRIACSTRDLTMTGFSASSSQQ